MRCNWVTAFGSVVLWVATAVHGLASDATPAASVTPVAQRKSAKKKAPKKVKKAKVPATRKKTRAAVVPSKPPADIPVVTEAAAVWQGCLESGGLPVLASRLKMDETHLGSLLAEEDLFGNEGGGCIPYAAVTGGEGGVASATFRRIDSKDGNSPIFTLRKTEDGVTVTPGVCDCPESAHRVLTVPAHEATDASNEVIAELPQNVRWQLGVLAPQMIARLAAEQADRQGAQSTSQDETLTDPYTMRVVVENRAETGPEHLESVEVLESATGRRVDGVWWLERPDGPGVFVGTEGAADERLLWQSPLKYNYKSRGVGPALTSYRRRVTAPKGSQGPVTVVRTFMVRGYHLGIDMVAPKGVEVHAVGDASVYFAGRLGGYGNLIILDHGRGYQTYYAHLSRIQPGVKPGAKVMGGEVIGLVGSTGHSTAPHLHFETRKDAKYIDPFDETRELEFWLLTADDQERLAMELLASDPTVADDLKVANRQELSASGDSH